MELAHLGGVVKIAPDVVTHSSSKLRELEDAQAEVCLLLLADGEGVGVDPCTIYARQGFEDSR